MNISTAVRYSLVGWLAAAGIALGWLNHAINRAVTLGGREA